ncbi:MAG: outer membrane beta-barrel protein [Ignavibacteriae bacterium]|nr:outer membrane beta-barrel protein [Ignavibacteriota bacterium]
MKQYILLFSLLLFFSSSVISQNEESVLSLGIHGGLFVLKNSEDGTKKNNSFITEFELAINFSKHVTLMFNYDFTSYDSKGPNDKVYYQHDLKEFSVGFRISPFKSRFTVFCEGQASIAGEFQPNIYHEAGVPFDIGFNIGIGAKYSIIKQLDAFLKIKRHFWNPYSFTVGINFNLPNLANKK